MGILDHLSDMCSMTQTKNALKPRKRRPLQVRFVEFKKTSCALLDCSSETFSTNFRSCQVIHMFPELFVEMLYAWLTGVVCYLQTVNIKVKMDCEGCERRVKNAVKSMRGTH
jgi:hypothetical protein